MASFVRTWRRTRSQRRVRCDSIGSNHCRCISVPPALMTAGMSANTHCCCSTYLLWQNAENLVYRYCFSTFFYLTSLFPSDGVSRTSDLQPTGHRVYAWSVHGCVVTVDKFSTSISFCRKWCNLVPAEERRRCSAAGKVIVGLTKSDGSHNQVCGFSHL